MSLFPRCNNELSLFHGIPYLFFPNDTNQPPSPITNLQDNFIHFWIHIGLVILGFLIAIISFFVQLCGPASYGKHADGSGRCPVPTKLFYVIAELIPGFIIFTITYFITGQSFSEPVNIVMYFLFTIHYLTRGLVMPFISRYCHNKITVWIPLWKIIANTLYH